MFGNDLIHANFSVDDLATAKEFYVDTLGFSIKKELPGQIIFEAGQNTLLSIYEKPDHKPWDSTVLGIETNDVEKAVIDLTNAGVSIERLPGTDQMGIIHDQALGDAAWFKDPAGNWLCVHHLTGM